jgi:hypothetical protein
MKRFGRSTQDADSQKAIAPRAAAELLGTEHHSAVRASAKYRN